MNLSCGLVCKECGDNAEDDGDICHVPSGQIALCGNCLDDPEVWAKHEVCSRARS